MQRERERESERERERGRANACNYSLTGYIILSDSNLYLFYIKV